LNGRILISGGPTVEPSTQFHGKLHLGNLIPCLVSLLLQIFVSVFKVPDPLSQPIGLYLACVNFYLGFLKSLVLNFDLLHHTFDFALCLYELPIKDVDLTCKVSELLLQGFNDVILLSQLHLQLLNLGLFGGGLDLLISGFDVSVESREDFPCCLDLS